MGLKQFFKIKYFISKEKKELNGLQKTPCDTSNLKKISDLHRESLFDSSEIQKMWEESKKAIDIFTIPDGSGGVNPGDRKALYYLISKFKPSSILEVGTHIGSSTLHIASALYMSQIKDGGNATLTTVDIADVNSVDKKPWLNYGSKYSPADMIAQLNHSSFVTFIADTSTNFASKTKQKFDFIFLDGSHTAHVVYQEIPLALKLLNPNGIILLHDFYPGMKPLWSDNGVIPGPYLAAERFIKEGCDITVFALGQIAMADQDRFKCYKSCSFTKKELKITTYLSEAFMPTHELYGGNVTLPL